MNQFVASMTCETMPNANELGDGQPGAEYESPDAGPIFPWLLVLHKLLATENGVSPPS